MVAWVYHRVLPLFIAPDIRQKSRVLFWLWVVLLFLAGVFIWGKFLNWWLSPFTYHDWADITIPRLTFLQDAVYQGVLPLHILDPFTLGNVTDRYLTIPDAFLSPQIVLLRWLAIGQFIWVNFLLLYTVGCLGLLWISLKKNLSLAALTFLFLLFNFNGHITAHISVGHYTWTAYFLYPWLIGLIFVLMEGSGGWPWVLKVSALLFVMLLQGGYHQFIYALFLLALLIPVLPRHFWTLCGALVFSVLLSAFRVLPPALNLGAFNNRFISGYRSPGSLWTALVQIYPPNQFTQDPGLAKQVGTWEYALFVGIAAALFLGWFGVVCAFRNRHKVGSYFTLLLPVIGLILLSLHDVFRTVRVILPLPLFTGERVSARILVLALLLLLVLAVIELQRWFNNQPALAPVITLLSAGAGLLMAFELERNLRAWSIPAAAQAFPLLSYQADRWLVANHPDLVYANILLIGGGISLAALTVLVFFTLRSHRSVARGLLPQEMPAAVR